MMATVFTRLAHLSIGSHALLMFGVVLVVSFVLSCFIDVKDTDPDFDTWENV